MSSDSVINKATTTNGRSSERGNRPPVFSGNRSEYENFVTKADLYIRLHPDKYDTDEKKVLFLVTYLDGDAFLWSKGWMAQRTKDPTTKQAQLASGSLDEFKKVFKDTYEPLNLAQESMDQLMRLKQGSSPAEEFVTKFRMLARQAGLTINPAANATDSSDMQLSQLFQRAINQSLFDRISLEAEQPGNLEGWFQTVIKRDLLWRTHKSRQEIFGGRKIPDRRTLAVRATASRPFNRLSNSTPITKLTPKERQYLIDNNGCFKCRELGHYSSNCKNQSSKKPEKPAGPPFQKARKPNQKYTPSSIRALVAELKENKYEEFLNLMDRPVSPSGSISESDEPVPVPRTQSFR
jgi:hypothetical protein